MLPSTFHFHTSKAVFIYDSISASQAGKLVPAEDLTARIIRGYDLNSDFAARYLAYRSVLELSLRTQVSPRHIYIELRGYWKQRMVYISKRRRMRIMARGRIRTRPRHLDFN